MKIVIRLLLLLIAIYAHTSSALAAAPGALNGAWVLDAKTTEESVLAAPPYIAAQWFGLASPYLVAFIYEFDGNDATIHMYGDQNRRNYQFLSQEGNQVTYVPKGTQEGGTDTLTVSILNDNNITISHSGSPEMGHITWKRVNLDPRRTIPDDAQPGMDAWFASLRKIIPVLNAPPNPAVNTDAAR
jgi:hypothetical protein